MFRSPLPATDKLRDQIRATYRCDEEAVVNNLIAQATLSSDDKARVQEKAYQLVANVRAADTGKTGIDALLHEYELTSKEGVILMCLAEALLRVPDAVTSLIQVCHKLINFVV